MSQKYYNIGSKNKKNRKRFARKYTLSYYFYSINLFK